MQITSEISEVKEAMEAVSRGVGERVNWVGEREWEGVSFVGDEDSDEEAMKEEAARRKHKVS